MRTAVFVLGALLAHTAAAQEIELGGAEDACPSRSAVAEALQKLLVTAHVTAHHARPALSVVVRDLGAEYLVATNEEKILEDPGRRCDERARAAALVIALAIDALPAPPPVPDVVRQPVTPPSVVVEEELGPYALIERPLVLLRGRALVKEEVIITSARIADDKGVVDRGAGGTNVFSFDFGVGHRLQLGGWIAAPFVQGTADLTVVPHVMVDLYRDLALRFELGFDRSHYAGLGEVGGDHNSALFALALLFRFRIHRMLAVTIGDTGPRDEWPGQAGRVSALLPGASRSLIALVASSGSLNATIGLPVGLIFQPHRVVALIAQLGPQLAFNQYGVERHDTALPVSLDVVVSPHRRLDLGAAFSLPLRLEDPASAYQAAIFVRLRL